MPRSVTDATVSGATMYTKSHLAVSAVLGVAIAAWLRAPPTQAAFLVAYAGLLGTAIDLDHFLVARLRAGDWRHLRFAAANPRAAFLDQEELFEEGAVGALTRLLSHGLIGGSFVLALVVVDPFLAIVTAVVLYVHVVCDLLASVREREPLVE